MKALLASLRTQSARHHVLSGTAPRCVGCLPRRPYAAAAAPATRRDAPLQEGGKSRTKGKSTAQASLRQEAAPPKLRELSTGRGAGAGGEDAISPSTSAAALNEPATVRVTSLGGESSAPLSPPDDALVEEELDSLAETHRSRFGLDMKDVPTIADLEALRPPRLKSFGAGMSQPFYIDRFNRAVQRLQRCFLKSQLIHLMKGIGYARQSAPTLTIAGQKRVRQLLREGDGRGEAELGYAVMGERTEYRKMKKASLGPNLKMVPKREIVEWIVSVHWGLKHPYALPRPSTLADLAQRQKVAEESVEMSGAEVFLLSVQRERGSSSPGLLYDIAREHKVTFEIVADPSSLLVTGTLGNRDAFMSALRRIRKPIVSRLLAPPLNVEDFPLTQDLLRALSHISGCFLQGNDFKEIAAFAYEEEHIRLAEQAIALFGATQSIHSQLPLFLATSAEDTGLQDTPLCLLPFMPRSRPAWYISTIATTYGRFARARSRRDDKTDADLPATEMTAPTTWACLRGDVNDPMSWLLDIPAEPGLGDLRLRATFGHHVYPTPALTVGIDPQFEGQDEALQLEIWNRNATPPAAFVPAPQYPVRNLAPLRHSSSSILQEPRADEVAVDPMHSVRTYISATPSLEEHGTIESFRVTAPRKGFQRVQRVLQRRATVMLPSQPLDVLLTAERRSQEDVDDPTSSACADDVMYFRTKGQTFVKMDQYTSQTINFSAAPSLPPDIRLRHERRRDLIFPDRPTELRGELLATAGRVSISDFVAAAIRLASASPSRSHDF